MPIGCPNAERSQQGYYFVHRLDMETSGCLLIAKSDAARDALIRDFSARKVRKVYLAVVAGSVVWDEKISTQPIKYVRGAVENSKSNVILPVDGVGDDSGSLREIGTQTAGVIHVVMGIDDVFDWLIRREARNFIHHRQRALFILRGFDNGYEVVEFDEHAVVRASAEPPHAVGQLCTFHFGRFHFGVSDGVRHGHGGYWRIRLHVGDSVLIDIVRGVQPRIALMDVDEAREHHAAVLLVAGIAEFIVHIAIHGIGEPGVRQFDQILIVDRAVNFVLAHRERNDSDLTTESRQAKVRGAIERHGDGRGILGRERHFQEPVGRQRQFKHSQIGVGNSEQVQTRERHGLIALHVLGVIAAHNGRDLDFRHRKVAEARVVALAARVVFTGPFGIVIDGTGVVGDLVLRPILV